MIYSRLSVPSLLFLEEIVLVRMIFATITFICLRSISRLTVMLRWRLREYAMAFFLLYLKQSVGVGKSINNKTWCLMYLYDDKSQFLRFMREFRFLTEKLMMMKRLQRLLLEHYWKINFWVSRILFVNKWMLFSWWASLRYALFHLCGSKFVYTYKFYILFSQSAHISHELNPFHLESWK